jgi:hypothetical protein
MVNARIIIHFVPCGYLIFERDPGKKKLPCKKRLHEIAIAAF